jgi:DNA ligase (NAD+)
MRAAGFEIARASIIDDLTAEHLSQLFTNAESKSPYQMDGIVIAPNVARSNKTKNNKNVKNPEDRVAWKTRLNASSARTIVREVEWNVSHLGYLIPRVLFDTVTISGANISAATGLHGRWIFENGVGPGAEIEVRRAGDVIPQIVAVLKRVEPSMPTRYTWVTDSVHVKPVGDDSATESACIQLTHALSELGAENVGPGVVAKLYAAGYTDLKKIYAASVADLATIDGYKEKGAERIYTGLRAKQASWTELNFLVASSIMPRGVGHRKLQPLLDINPTPSTWNTSMSGPGLSEKTIAAIVAAIPAYLAWKSAMGLHVKAKSKSKSKSDKSEKPETPEKGVIVFTGVRDKELEASLIAKGYTIADTVTKKTTHLIYGDTTTKYTKAKEMGLPLLTLEQAKTEL